MVVIKDRWVLRKCLCFEACDKRKKYINLAFHLLDLAIRANFINLTSVCYTPYSVVGLGVQ